MSKQKNDNLLLLLLGLRVHDVDIHAVKPLGAHTTTASTQNISQAAMNIYAEQSGLKNEFVMTKIPLTTFA